MDGYGNNYDAGFYHNSGGGDLLPPNDDDDDFDPLELLHSPLFDENDNDDDGGGGDAGGMNNNNTIMINDQRRRSSEDSSSHHQDYAGPGSYLQQQQHPGMPGGMDSSQASHASAPPYIGGGRGNYPNQAYNQYGGGGAMSSSMQNATANNTMSPQNMSINVNMNGMNNNMGNMNGMNGTYGMPGGNQMGGASQMMSVGPMNSMNNGMASMGPMNTQMNQLQSMQQSLMMQQNRMQPGPDGNPMMNMQAMGGPMMGPNPNMQAMGMQNMQGMNNPQIRNGSLNNAVSNLPGPINGLNMSMHASMPNIGFQPQRGGSLPTSPNGMPSVAQMNASIRAGNSSRTGGRTRGPTPKVDVNGKVIPETSNDPGINEAMEKLCESMRRSAMSRNLVKQLSGRSIQRTGSARSLSRSNSGVGMRKQQMLGRSLSGGLSRGDDGSGRSGTPTRIAPIRRLSNSKHRLQGRAAPGNRGTFRTNSMGSQASAHSQGGNTFLQLDDQSLGAL